MLIWNDHFFLQVNFWTQGELLRADILKTRIEILSHFIRVAKVNSSFFTIIHNEKYFLF